MQGLHDFIPTEKKAAYINTLLQVGFDTIDFGSFVSPKAIPQMRDTAELLGMLDLSSTQSKLSAIVANLRGANDAALFDQIDYLGYPFSISETFQIRNTNATIEQSLSRVEQIQEVCKKSGKEMILYISMGFGNPYGDPWNVDICQKWVDRLIDMDISIFALSDTIGVGNQDNIYYLFSNLIPAYPDALFGAHLHTRPDTWQEKVDAAYQAGCRRFDGAIKGYGGCPMAKDELTGNMPTECLLQFINDNKLSNSLNMEAFRSSLQSVDSVMAQ